MPSRAVQGFWTLRGRFGDSVAWPYLGKPKKQQGFRVVPRRQWRIAAYIVPAHHQVCKRKRRGKDAQGFILVKSQLLIGCLTTVRNSVRASRRRLGSWLPLDQPASRLRLNWVIYGVCEQPDWEADADSPPRLPCLAESGPFVIVTSTCIQSICREMRLPLPRLVPPLHGPEKLSRTTNF
ncbi:hypothetical protein VTI74DRAFT_1047 [Chaetomium olivicolor]